ncbi:hypothetical protein OG342_08865 [Streptomyces bobili]|uniref:hypothetical protein n=1 Tax=Streptomyces bobili TaxID=67280 RepID=UPI0022546C59|nr:hypothetical protein [Streptomyces bobili]MCX5522971.1 hypothetical protein [Streptomyces bobili]
MTTRTGSGRPHLVASAVTRGPVVRARYRMRLRVDGMGFVQPRSADDRTGFMNTYAPGTIAELDFGMGRVLADYDAVLIAETVSRCATVHLLSRAATGERPHIEHGTAYNADGVLYLMSQAIEHVAARRGNPEC